jgi:ABC-type glycerol-3-phosphate transport system permease component
MKFLKWLLIVVLVIVALVLIIPLFFPATVKFSASQEIAVSPAQAFVNIATYTDRNKWDPWLPIDPDAKWTVEAKPDYVGSLYTWNGKKVGTGQEMVDSVVFGKYIAANLRFGNDLEGSLIEWNLEPAGSGTLVTWSFTDKTKYPLESLPRIQSSSAIGAVSYPAMDVIQAIHYGPYDDLMSSYNKIMDYIAVNQLKITCESMEIYNTDPSMEPDVTKLQTIIAFPLR